MKLEQALEVIKISKTGRHFSELVAHFGLFQTEQVHLSQFIDILLKYQLVEETSAQTFSYINTDVIGTITLNPRGFGFVTPERFEAPNIFIDPLDLGDARHRDRIALTLYSTPDGRYRGKVTRILERGMQSCVGIYRKQDGMAWLSPQNEKLPTTIPLIQTDDTSLQIDELEEGSLLAVALSDQHIKGQLLAIPLHVVNPNDSQGQLEAVIYNQGIRLNLSREAQEHAERFTDIASPEEYKKRKDFRCLPFITIDPNSAKDFDDALYAQPSQSSGWVLWVAIADVTHYVKEGDPIDQEAQQKSATLYLPAQAFPMLPHRLSNDLCSLKPQVDRLAVVAQIEVSANGDIEGAQFHEAVIHSKARLTYDEAATLLGILPETDLPKHITRQSQNVTAIRDCSRALKNRRRRRGFLNLDLIEPRLNFDVQGMVESFKVTPRHEAHEMVEEAMLAANESVAAHCIAHSIPALYRIHATPPDRGVDRFVIQSKLLGAPLIVKKKLKAHHLSKYLRDYEDHPHSELLSSLLLRSMSRAAYQPKPDLHFGLGTDTYLHFTSPIRRYPDLWVHRQLKQWMNQDQDQDQGRVNVSEVAGYASRRERIVMEAERKVLDAYKALFMKDHIGATYSGVVCQTSPKGFFVDLNDYPIWCSHQIDKLPGSFRYDEELFMWRDATSRRRITLGSEVSVRIIAADVSGGRVEVVLAEL